MFAGVSLAKFPTIAGARLTMNDGAIVPHRFGREGSCVCFTNPKRTREEAINLGPETNHGAHFVTLSQIRLLRQTVGFSAQPYQRNNNGNTNLSHYYY